MSRFTDKARQDYNRTAYAEDGVFAECQDCGSQLVEGPRCRGCDPTDARTPRGVHR